MNNGKIKRTNYSKTAKKGEPTTIRWDKERVAFILEKEGLKSIQQLFDFFVDKYWWQNKFGSNPVLERQSAPINTSPIKAAYVSTTQIEHEREEPKYSNDWFREAFSNAKDAQELDAFVKLMYQKIEGKWSQGQLKEDAQNVFNDKFNF